jgi:putative transposase
MYDYRKTTPDERQQVLKERSARGFPLHSPPHFHGFSGYDLITAACLNIVPFSSTPKTFRTWLTNY